MQGLSANLLSITIAVWSFLTRHVNKSFRKSLRALVNSEELNGIELPRILRIRYEGGASDIEVAALSAPHAFLGCPDGTVLQQYLGGWLSIVQELKGDLPSRHLSTLLIQMLPGDQIASESTRRTIQDSISRKKPSRHSR